jgi:separase
MQFESRFQWDQLIAFQNGVIAALEGDDRCFGYFENVLCSTNFVIQREAVSYYVTACRMFNVTPDLWEWEEICATSRDTAALWLYHSVIAELRYEDINRFWSHDNPQPPNAALLNALSRSESLAQGYAAISRKIKQLRALITGRNDQSRTAELIATSVSLSLDKFISKILEDRFKLQFPLLAIIYIAIPTLDSCLLMALFHPNSPPFVVRLGTGDKMDVFLDALAHINRQSTAVSPTLSTADWWGQKRDLDCRLKDLLTSFENDVLGLWKGLLTPLKFSHEQNPARAALLAAIATHPRHEQPVLYRQLGFSLPRTGCTGRHPIALLLGRHAHRVPWESLPCVLYHEISVTRVPSLKLVALQAAKRLPRSVDPSSAFYVLNPAGDLPSTESTFGPLFSKLAWPGLVGTQPDAEVIERAMLNKDLFVYCGHGSGLEYYNYESLVEDGKPCRSSLLLMGCSSGELNDDGDMDPNGVPYHCVAAGAGAVVANLWNVTDRDIDRFLMALLDGVVGRGPQHLGAAVSIARKACKLRYLTGAAPVTYGFPTVIGRC